MATHTITLIPGDGIGPEVTEAVLRITRACLEVFAKHRNPVGIVTKNYLVTRDLDILRDIARLVHPSELHPAQDHEGYHACRR